MSTLKRKVFVMLAVLALAIAQIACEGNPCEQGNACQITAPISNPVEQGIIDTLSGDNPQNVLSGGNP